VPRFVFSFAGILVISALLSRTAGAVPVSDEFIRGYASAILQRDFHVTVQAISVHDGVIQLQGLEATDVTRERVHKMLSSIEGVRQVVIADKEEAPGPETQPAIIQTLPVFLPTDLLFRPLLADPRWPHFSGSYQHYSDSEQLDNVGSATFGETFSIYRFEGPWSGAMEFGIQAGVFSIFDLDAESFDLVNADYFVALPFSYKKGAFTTLSRIFHQSSHLGDEFLLRGRARERINLSYEGIDTILSYALPYGARIYAGGGWLFDQEPSDLDPWNVQYGFEFRSPWTMFNGAVRPIAAVDVQNREEGDWDADVSVRAGVQFEDPIFLSRRLMLLLEYYDGRSPNGQFYTDDIEYFGIGLHFFYD
jgi:hypothetical protein